jgi:hypothetical protein
MNKGRWVFEPSTDPQVEDDIWVLSGSVYSVQVASPSEYLVMEFHEAQGWGQDHGLFKTLKEAMAKAEALANRKRGDFRMNGRPGGRR